ncbi:hypothetical protein M569_05053 [Genlisea aurea]|uniref:Membrane-associated kinase regulator 4 n=1 Tax=Genlisea aurea TaxID=192259 RepID=S8EAZ3_9LAMI|nr:hypothetical protein M569_05053 [Genlisea aurea]
MPLRSCSTAPGTNSVNTPVDSCNISPSESRRVSCELNPDDYFFEWSSEMSSFIRDDQHPILKKPWSKKLKLMKHSIFVQKLKASRAYLRSLFTKSGGGCSDEIIASGNNPKEAQNSQKEEDESYPKTSKKKPSYPTATISSILKNMDRNGGTVEDITHRRSFSGAIKRRPPAALCLSTSSSSSSSSSCSSSANASVGFQDAKQFFLRRSSSATEIENSIQAAIAHCKRSQQVLDSINKSEIITS